MFLPAPSKGWCLNPKGSLSGTPYHPFGTPWRVLVPSSFPLSIYPEFLCNHFLHSLLHLLQGPPSKGPFRNDPSPLRHEARAPIRDLILHGRRNLWGSRGGLEKTPKNRGDFRIFDLPESGSTIRNLLHWENRERLTGSVCPLGDVGFQPNFFRVVSGDYGKPCWN